VSAAAAPWPAARRLLFLSSVVSATALLTAGCGDRRLARAPLPPADLTGHWMLDPAASDDAAALIAAAIPKPRAQPRPEAAPGPAPGGDDTTSGRRGGRSSGGRRGATTGGGAAGGRTAASEPEWGRRGPGEFVRSFALPATRLDIVAQADRVSITAGERHRAFEPGAEDPVAVTDRFGSRDVRAGWDKSEFVIESSDRSRLKVVERFRRGANDTLESALDFSAQGIKSLHVHAVYRRASAAEAASSALDGPPAPGPR
jgi:hypothetical protein